MKSLIILVLLILLGAGAFLSCPSESDFETYYRLQEPAKKDSSVIGAIFKIDPAAQYLKDANYKNYFLFSTVERNGRAEYIGAFNHWFKRTPPATASAD